MHEILLLCLGLILSVSFLVVLANKLKIAYPIFLVIAGLACSFIPGIPNIHIDPNLVFLVILPPVLYDAAQNTSWKALWKWRRIITVMALGYVLLTATVVAIVSHLLIPGFSLAQGFLLGAIISPPDAAAATSVLRYIKMPKGIVAILEGESLLNDASSLTIFRFALAAIISSNFVWYHAAGGFFMVVFSGIAIGMVLGLIFYAIYRWLPTNSNLDIAFSLVLPYLIYIIAEELHSSGVLAVVSGGLFISYKNHFVLTHSSRLKSNAVWPSLVFIINAVIFFLIGLQVTEIVAGLKDISLFDALKIALIITAVVIVIRLLAGLFSAWFTRFISQYITVAQSRPGWRNPLIVSWTGMRGVVSLASALSIPLLLNKQPFPHRNLILFITFVVIIVTLVGQGLTLPFIVRKLKPEPLSEDKTDDQQILEIEIALLERAVEELGENYPLDLKNNVLLQNKLDLLKNKLKLYSDSCYNEPQKKVVRKMIARFRSIVSAIIEQQRAELHQFRTKDKFDDDVIRQVENRLDLEEEGLQGEVD
jgi:Na+/H+ antiporter